MKYVKQDISTVTTGVIAHGCNYVGVMGAGVAAVLRSKFPACFIEYAKWLQNFPDRKDALGACQVVKVGEDLYVANCITQGLQSYDGQLATPEAIHESIESAYAAAKIHNLPLYLPKIGAGLGGLDWEQDVEPIIQNLANKFSEVDTYICVYP
ncbi:MAG: macro domain-containing protein [Thaumarchaeota archaeon]|nr:macro domain-containing protein [Nitrososphaerota archaeon]